jgi:D-methionine transport system substrate-binding protein
MKKTALSILLSFLLFVFVACGSKTDIDDYVLVVGASPVPHAVLLEAVRQELEEQGYTLRIVEFTDYVLPNSALASKELDANFFQHLPYLSSFNENHGTTLVSAGAVHFEPLGIYAGTRSSLQNLPQGTKIAIPNDATNRARALLLLQANGLLSLPATADLTVTVQDIVANPFGLEIVELEAAGIPARLGDVGLAVINGNYAINANITDKRIVSELPDSLAATTYANIVVVRSGDQTKPAILALMAALQSDHVRRIIAEQYPGAVFPVF